MASQTQPEAPEQAPDQEASRRERLGYLLRHSKLWLIGLILLAVAAAVAAGSLAVFTSSSANPENTASGGILTQSNSKDDAAILTALRMVPGQSENGTVTITNTGDVEGNFSLSDSALTNYTAADAATTTAPLFSDVLELTVVDESANGGPNEIYKGDIDALDTVAIPGATAAAWQPGEEHQFTFTVRFVPQADDATDNQYQGLKTTVQYDWTAVSTDQ